MARSGPRTALRIIPVRDDCLLVELAGLDQTLALLDALAGDTVAGVIEIIPAARTLLIRFDPDRLPPARLADEVVVRAGRERAMVPGELLDIPVRYDGEDMTEVAVLAGLSPDEVVRRHTAGHYVAAFTGFAPGFAYLSGGDPRLNVARRKSPRTQVPAGSVGLAGEFSGVYPRASPGGWQLIGRTPLVMFEPDRVPASLLKPGTRVRFRNMAEGAIADITIPVRALPDEDERPALQGSAMEVLGTALPVLFQDFGRKGQSAQGISISGAADRASLSAANRLVGNPANSPALEIALGGFGFRMHGAGVIAITGATSPMTITPRDGVALQAPHHAAIALDDGDIVAIGTPSAGVRAYLAARGGFAVTPVLGSAARDTLAQIGPPPLQPGQRITILPAPPGALVTTEMPAFAMPASHAICVLDVFMGPRTDWFTAEAVRSFLTQEWAVTALSSRVGLRLAGTALGRQKPGELPSEATVRGAVQVPPEGQPVLFLADHPLTGGYPVIASVAEHHLDLAGQMPVGGRIRFNALNTFAPQEFPKETR
ncbi:urea amidolyase family protein [Devosia sp.]|uniref:5-oxoprolinase subunit B/C family protein n=1 Tax=Devosia sp. TaxID=1871048 RepID=UPI002AFDE3AB|nr:urea amidolyase family protein [Devosia sp.]